MDNQDTGSLVSNDPFSNLDFRPGALISGRYEILEFLGRGGMSVAIKAMDNRLNRVVTVKFLLPERLANPKDRARFQREAMAAGQLQHPSISKIFAFEFDEHSRPYLVMEYIEGQTLARRIESEGQLPIDETIEIFILVTEALAFAHANGILHRDIKPSNIMLTTPNHDKPSSVKLLDFGLAKLMQDQSTTATQITNTGELLGSPFYMSPEQARGGQLDARSDLYSVGCTIYEALTGSPPHLGQTALATILKRETDKPIAMGEASLGRAFPADLERLVSKLLETNPDDRYQTATQLLTDLRNLKSSDASVPEGKIANVQIERSSPGKTAKLSARRTLIGVLIISALPIFGIAWLTTKREHARTQPLMWNFGHALKIEDDWLKAQAILKEAERYKTTGQYARALAAYKKALEIYKKIHLPKEPDVADVLVDMVDCYLMQNNCAEAKKYVTESVELYKDMFGEETKNFCVTLNTVGARCLAPAPVDPNDAWQIAQPVFDRSNSLINTLYGADSAELTVSLCQQAKACVDRGLVREAASRCDKAMVLSKRLPTRALDQNVQAMALAAQVYAKIGDFKKLDHLSQRFVSDCEDVPPLDKPYMAEWPLVLADQLMNSGAKENLANTFNDRALFLYQNVLATYEESPKHGKDTPSRKKEMLLKSYANLGRYFRLDGDRGNIKSYRLAESYYIKALALLENDDRNWHLRQQTLGDIAYLAKAQGRPDEARKILEKATLVAPSQSAHKDPR